MIPTRLYMGYDEYSKEMMEKIIEMLKTCFTWVELKGILLVEPISRWNLEEIMKSAYKEPAKKLLDHFFGEFDDDSIAIGIKGIPLKVIR